MFAHARITSSRIRCGFSRSKLHQELVLVGVRRCRALIDHWETGRSEPRASELFGLASVLGVPISDFFESGSTDSP